MRTATAGVALVIAAATGCSTGDPAPAEVRPLASGTATPSSQALPSTPSSLEPSKGSSPASGVPTAATPGSPQGARAFAVHYFASVVNDAYATGDADQVAALSDPACGSCGNIVADVARLTKAGLRVAGDRFRLAFAEAAPPDADGSVVVDFRFSSDAYVEVDKAGKVIRTEPPQVDQDAQVKLVWHGSWTVVAIRTL